MSESYMNLVQCPKCGQKQKFLMWKTINTKDDPDMKAKVRNKEVFRMTCEKCGEKVNADHPFLYHEAENQIMIYYVREEDVETVINETGPALPGYIKRAVSYQNDLVEKLMIFDAGLDDRIIEIVKAIYVDQLYQEAPEKYIEEVLFDNTGDGYRIIFMTNGKVLTQAPMPMETYNAVEKEFKGKMPKLRTDKDVVVDFEWAMNLMQPEQEEE